MESKNIRMASPWVEYYREIEALFGEDPEIGLEFNEADNVIKLMVDNTDKAAAIEKLLPAEKAFGNVVVRTVVIPANLEEKSRAGLIEVALRGNPAFEFAQTVELLSNPIHYIVMQKKVVQYPIDNLHDIDGKRSTLFEAIARDVIGEEEGVCFCTASENYVV